MPLASSKGWLGCSRTLIRPFRPMVLRNAVVTAHFLATRIRSWLRISFETPAAISGVIPRETFASVSLVAASDNSQSRKPPTVSDGNRRKSLRRMGIEDQPGDLVVLVRDHGLVEELLERHVGERHPRRDHLFGAFGRNAGKTSPDRGGVALASSSRKSANT